MELASSSATLPSIPLCLPNVFHVLQCFLAFSIRLLTRPCIFLCMFLTCSDFSNNKYFFKIYIYIYIFPKQLACMGSSSYFQPSIASRTPESVDHRIGFTSPNRKTNQTQRITSFCLARIVKPIRNKG